MKFGEYNKIIIIFSNKVAIIFISRIISLIKIYDATITEDSSNRIYTN